MQQLRDVRDFRVDVVLVGTHDSGMVDITVENLQRVALADQQFRQVDQRAFAQVIGTGFERQTEQADVLLAERRNQIERTIDLGDVAAHDRGEHRVVRFHLR